MYSTVFRTRSIFKSMRNEPIQDVALAKNNFKDGYIALALADGVSEAAFSRKGADETASFLLYHLQDNYKLLISEKSETAVDEICSEIENTINSLAERYETDIREFGSTLCGIVTDGTKLFYFSIGDSIIFAVTDDGKIRKIAEHCGERNIFTDNFERKDIKYGVMDTERIISVYLASDGFVSEIFEHGSESLKPDTSEFVINNNFRDLNSYFKNKVNFDDCSYCCAVLKE